MSNSTAADKADKPPVANKPPADDIESQLLGGTSDPYLSLSDEGEDAYLSIEDDDFLGRNKTERLLKGNAAMRFLGLPSRPHNHLKRGDITRITERFETLLKRLRKSNAEDTFWNQITIQVWNKKNLAVLNNKVIKGKATAPAPSIGLEGGEYFGDVMKGSAISDFLSEQPNAQKWREFFIQVISVNVTEEMSRAN